MAGILCRKITFCSFPEFGDCHGVAESIRPWLLTSGGIIADVGPPLSALIGLEAVGRILAFIREHPEGVTVNALRLNLT